LRLAVLVPPADYGGEWRWAFDPQAKALRDAGAEVDALPWNGAHELAGYDLTLPLVAWGYHQRFPEWLAFLDRLERTGTQVANSVPVLRWNSDKAYLAELSAAGISTVPSIAFDDFGPSDLADARRAFGCSDLVAKPTVSASAFGTYRLGASDPFPEPVRGWRMLVQPWLKTIVSRGEYSLIFFDGKFSHAVVKVPRPGEFRVQPEFGGIITHCAPPDGALDLAEAALTAAPSATVYARVDLVVGNEGELQVIELELIEPALFLAQAPHAAPAFAAAVLSAAERAREQPLANC
jgi:glutathione synthase/RimK-type ligase-like ATP-grasp enzyme